MIKKVKLWILLLCSIVILGENPPTFGPRIAMGIIENDEIDEASGIVASYKNKGALWTLNDSGNDNKVFAFDSLGANLGEYTLNNIENRDWEDIAIGSGPDDEKTYLYVADIGDNEAQYTIKYIYRIEEPKVLLNQSSVKEVINNVERISFYYPDGERDAETLMLDPLTKDLYIVSKRDSKVRLYRLPYPQSTSVNIQVKKEAEFTVPNDPEEDKPFNYITAGDISIDGTEIILKSYRNIYYWKKATDKTIAETLTENIPDILPFTNSIDETQSEAVCFKPYDDKGYYTLSEEKVEYNGITLNFPAVLYYYPRTSVVNYVKKNGITYDFKLKQNYPNPFNPTTTIVYSIPNSVNSFLNNVKLNVFDIKGKEISILVNKKQTPGDYEIKFDATNLSSGIYFYQLKVGKFSECKKMLLIK